MAEKEVHGCVEPGTGLDDQDHAQVPQQSDYVDGQEDQKQGQLELRICWEAQENESDLSTLVCLVPVEKISMLIQKSKN